MKRHVFVTGASGFIGSRLRGRLDQSGARVTAFSRHGADGVAAIGDMDGRTDWRALLAGVDAVVHLAARVHVMHDTAADPLAAFRTVNVEGTRSLASSAAAVGVRRLVFMSSIKVHGECTAPGAPLHADDSFAPHDPYAQSKAEAEQALRKIAAETGLEVVVIRPPLVYGPGVGANFARLMRLVEKGIPLPFGLVDNRRSLVALDNLVDLVVRCIKAPMAAGRTFLVSDRDDLSTSRLLREMARAMGKRPKLVPIPPAALRFAGRLMGRQDEVDRLCGSLQVDISDTCSTLDWAPPVSVQDALGKTVEHFLETRS